MSSGPGRDLNPRPPSSSDGARSAELPDPWCRPIAAAKPAYRRPVTAAIRISPAMSSRSARARSRSVSSSSSHRISLPTSSGGSAGRATSSSAGRHDESTRPPEDGARSRCGSAYRRLRSIISLISGWRFTVHTMPMISPSSLSFTRGCASPGAPSPCSSVMYDASSGPPTSSRVPQQAGCTVRAARHRQGGERSVPPRRGASARPGRGTGH